MKVAILSTYKKEEAETFIQNHINNLPFEKIVIYGGNYPHLTENYHPTFLQRLYLRISNKINGFLKKEITSIETFSLKHILRKEKVAVVFAEYLTTAAKTYEVCEQLGIPMTAIALGHDISVHETIDNYSSKYRSLFQYAKYIFVVSEHMSENLLKLDCPKHKIVFTPAGPEKSFFKIKPSFKKPQVLAVGRFVDKKAPHLSILAFLQVLNSIPNATLVMAGDGPLLNVCKDLVHYYKISKSVKFVGKITPIQHRKLLQESCLFVQHSKTAENGDSEGTPVAILEASAAGLPVVSTKHAGIPSVVTNGKTGYLVAENDIDAMAEKMIDIISNQEKAKLLGQNARAFVKTNFSLEKHIDILTDYTRKANIKEG